MRRLPPLARVVLTDFLSKDIPQTLDAQASQLLVNALERTNSQQPGAAKSPNGGKNGGSAFGKSFSSMMGGLSSLSLTRTSTRDRTSEDKDRGRSMLKIGRMRSASQAPGGDDTDESRRSVSRARSQSPFTLRRLRTRDPSPASQPVRMSQSDVDLSDSASSILPQSTAYTDADADDESGDDLGETDDESPYEDIFDPITEANTERNSLVTPVPADGAGLAPVMVARRRLKRPPRKNACLSTHRTHVSLAEAGIDHVAAKVDEDVQVLRNALQADESWRDGGPGSCEDPRFAAVAEGEAVEEGENEDETDDEPVGVKVAG